MAWRLRFYLRKLHYALSACRERNGYNKNPTYMNFLKNIWDYLTGKRPAHNDKAPKPSRPNSRRPYVGNPRPRRGQSLDQFHEEQDDYDMFDGL